MCPGTAPRRFAATRGAYFFGIHVHCANRAVFVPRLAARLQMNCADRAVPVPLFGDEVRIRIPRPVRNATGNASMYMRDCSNYVRRVGAHTRTRASFGAWAMGFETHCPGGAGLGRARPFGLHDQLLTGRSQEKEKDKKEGRNSTKEVPV